MSSTTSHDPHTSTPAKSSAPPPPLPPPPPPPTPCPYPPVVVSQSQTPRKAIGATTPVRSEPKKTTELVRGEVSEAGESEVDEVVNMGYESLSYTRPKKRYEVIVSNTSASQQKKGQTTTTEPGARFALILSSTYSFPDICGFRSLIDTLSRSDILDHSVLLPSPSQVCCSVETSSPIVLCHSLRRLGTRSSLTSLRG
jgi:hypothetical protein